MTVSGFPSFRLVYVSPWLNVKLWNVLLQVASGLMASASAPGGRVHCLATLVPSAVIVTSGPTGRSTPRAPRRISNHSPKPAWTRFPIGSSGHGRLETHLSPVPSKHPCGRIRSVSARVGSRRTRDRVSGHARPRACTNRSMGRSLHMRPAGRARVQSRRRSSMSLATGLQRHSRAWMMLRMRLHSLPLALSLPSVHQHSRCGMVAR